MSQRLPVVGVLVASPAELTVMQQAGAILEKLDIPHEIRVISPSRSPDVVDEFARTAFDRGMVMICTDGDLGPPGRRRGRAHDAAGHRRADQLGPDDGHDALSSPR